MCLKNINFQELKNHPVEHAVSKTEIAKLLYVKEITQDDIVHMMWNCLKVYCV